MSFRNYLSMVIHRYLRVPYTLYTHEFKSPKKPRATYVLIHGIGNTLQAWDKVAASLPDDVRVIGIDLLGFGNSPQPEWTVYSAKTQARSVGATLFRLKLTQRPIIVGHSLGALVAVEIARRYPLLPRQLVLCSPPFYKPDITEESVLSADVMLRRIYGVAIKYPDQLEQLSPFAVKLGLANKALNITSDNIPSYLGALESSIINQTSLYDVAKLKLPIHIFYGAFDPVVIRKHITALEANHENVTAEKLRAGHEVVGGYVKSLVSYLSAIKIR